MNDREIAEFAQRPRRYANVDGGGEIELGFITLGITLLGWATGQLPPDSLWQRADVSAALIFATIGLAHGSLWLFRRRVTYRRTGYAAPRRELHWRAGLLSLLVALAVAWMAARHVQAGIAVALYGLVVAAAYGYNLSPGAAWKWIIAAAQAAGAVSVALAGGTPEALQRALMLFGVLSLVSGSISLVLYLRRTATAPLEAE